MTWMQVYQTAAAHLDAAAGYYNNNVRVDTEDGAVNVRIPIRDADTMDLRIWHEADILPVVGAYVDRIPRLLYRADTHDRTAGGPVFQVHEFIEGAVLDAVAPRGVQVPAHVLSDVVELLVQLTAIPRQKLPATPEGWPDDGDVTGFGRQLSDLTRRVWETYREEYAAQYAAFGFPANPLALVEASWQEMTSRPLVCVHADIHRKNIIINNGRCYFLDWELALWGDPVYDMAVHLHKMGYRPDERDTVLRMWTDTLPDSHTVGWERDLDIYIAHEQIKSAIVDIVRYTKALVEPGYGREPENVLIDKLAGKLTDAYSRWGLSRKIGPTEVEAILRRQAEPPI